MKSVEPATALRTMPPRRSRVWMVVAVLVPVLMACGVYAPSLRGAFVIDDVPMIRDGSYIHTASNGWDVLTLRVLSQDVVDFNRPVQLASLMLDAAIWGRNPAGYRATNLLLHAATTGLVAFLALSFLTIPGRWRSPAADLSRGDSSFTQSTDTERWRAMAAMVAGLGFALHPIMAEAVCVPTNREDLLATFFSLLALAAAMAFDPARRGAAWIAVGVCVVACFMAVASKESGAVAAVLVVGFVAWLRPRERVLPRAMLACACTLIVGLFLAARFLFQPTNSTIFTEPPTRIGASLIDVFCVQARIWTFDLSQIFWPDRLAAIYTSHTIMGIPLPVAIGVVVAAAVAMVVAACRDRRAALAVVLVVAAIAPVSNFVPIFNPIADRYLYMPMVGLSWCAALIGYGIATRAKMSRLPLLAISLLAVAALVTVTNSRVSVWHDNVALMRDVLRTNPGAMQAQAGLAGGLIEAGRGDEAAPILESLVRQRRDYADYWMLLAIAYEIAHRPNDADRAFSQAVSLNPKLVQPTPPVEGAPVNPGTRAHTALAERSKARLLGR